MDIRLTWDLFVLVFFAIIVAYSFIIGQNSTLKIILGTYAGALAADAAGNLSAKYLLLSKGFLNLLSSFGADSPDTATAVIKILLFIFFVIVLTVRAGIEVESPPTESFATRFILTGVFGFLSAGLMLSTVLMYSTGISFLTGSTTHGPASILAFSGQSPFIQNLLNYYNWFFLLPIVAILLREFLAGREE